MAKKWPYIFIALIALILIGGVFVLTKGSSPKTSEVIKPDGYEYFWGDGCPHCANVAAFMETWEGTNKIKMDKKEVYNNPSNARLMTERYTQCNIPRSQMGVPLLVTPEGKCLTGDIPIIDHFKSLKFDDSTATESAEEQ